MLLFDELSYDAMFPEAGAPRAGALSWSSLLATARVYHDARSPATKTLRSIGSYLAALPGERLPEEQATPTFIRDDGSRGALREALRERGLFHEAKRRGYRTEVLGWYFPYCEELAGLVDACRTFSMYNAGTAREGFSVADPFLTIANMWPYQWPTGLAKRPAAVWLQKTEYRRFLDSAGDIESHGPTLRWVHFNVPHRPWIQDAGPFAAHAFDASPRRYHAQLREVDLMIASFLDGLRASGGYEDATVVLTSDHGTRDGLGAGDPLSIPLVVHAAGETTHEDVRTRVEARRIVNDVVKGACGLQ